MHYRVWRFKQSVLHMSNILVRTRKVIILILRLSSLYVSTATHSHLTHFSTSNA